MKKNKVIIFSLLVMVLISCSSVGGTKNGNTLIVVKEGVVNQMSTEMFKNLVYNYQKNPKDWIYEGSLPCIIDFYADWCRPCKMVAPIMDDLAKQYKGKVVFYKVNTDEERELSQVFNIRSIPALLYVPRNGKPQMSVGAYNKENYIQQINTFLLATDAEKR